MAKGYTQSYGIDYLETFAPVARMTTIRILITLVAKFGWKLQQFDVKNAFLYKDLEEKVFMEIPPSFKHEGDRKNQVCKLKKAYKGSNSPLVHGLEDFQSPCFLWDTTKVDKTTPYLSNIQERR